jgi:crotonobetainyl-CoA:carnitine CoA-transferase CaiB-like acyl-CoA transferase
MEATMAESMEGPAVRDILAALWRDAGGDPAALDRVRLTGGEPALPSSFRVGAAAQATIVAAGLAAAEMWRCRTGRRQEVAVDMLDAAVEFRSERYLRVDGRGLASFWDPIAGVYETQGGRFVRLHTNFAHHRDAVLRLLGCANTREAVAAALAALDCFAFETAANEGGAVVSAMRSPAEWQSHPQAAALADLPLFRIEKIGEAPPRPLPAAGERPLSGLRVLDLTRIVAGPVGGRTLAAHGADVMRIAAPGLPFVDWLAKDTGRGKLSAYADLATEAGRAALRRLVADADIVSQGFRPGALAARGFAPSDLARLRPGIVYVSLSAYGDRGPWALRRGFDSLVQTATGFNHEEGRAAGIERPKELPCQALDHASGYLMAFAAMMARMRQAREGGSWLVQVSLAQTGRWLWRLGRVACGLEGAEPSPAEVEDRLESSASPFGEIRAVRHAARLSETTAGWARPTVPLGTHEPVWP